MAGDAANAASVCAIIGSPATGRYCFGTAPPARTTVDLSSDPAFRGDARHWNPEALVVLAASSCQLLSFLAVAARARVDVVDYQDDAEGEMPEAVTPIRITRVVLHPRITVRGDVAESRLLHLVEVAHRGCFVANSLTTDIVVEPTFLAAP